MQDRIIRISVRDLVEFVMRSGDIDNRISSNVRAVDGIRAHQKLQSNYGEDFEKEVTLKIVERVNDVEFQLEGRADGVSITDSKIIVDEIKSTSRNLDEMEYDSQPLHWAQAKCYAYILAKENGREEVKVQLSYYHVTNEELKVIDKVFDIQTLEEFFFDLLERYLEFSNRIIAHREALLDGVAKMTFPFDEYREGQRRLAVSVYNIIKNGKTLFAQAPTGVGKTISTLFPAIKSIDGGHSDKVFYLTSRNTQQRVALDTIYKVDEKEKCLKTLRIIAKDRLCQYETNCNPKSCPLAKGHYDRVNNCILDIYDNVNHIDEEIIEEYSVKHGVCPFELQLDMANYSDIIVCDYNYVFDPHVQLRRFFETPMEKYTILVDEAHNLVDRGRDMYSTSISEETFIELKDKLKKHNKLNRANEKVINAFDTLNLVVRFNAGNVEDYYQSDHIDEFYKPANSFIDQVEKYFTSIREEDEELDSLLLDAYFSLYRYLKIDELYDKNYLTLCRKYGKEIELKCVDTSKVFKEILDKVHSCIYFSATLNPIDYYKYLLGGDTETQFIRIDSPFDKENLSVYRYPISTKYRQREHTKVEIAKIIEIASSNKGNYLVFFPSYEYMELVYDEVFSEKEIIMQERNMTSIERDAFLERFEDDGNIIGFVVMGGIFSEGIDLKGDRLKGVIIVSVGLPKFSFEQEVLKDYFEDKFNSGYEYAYLYPSSNKISQSGGRLIRTKTDMGIVLLIDDRFLYEDYVTNLPIQWEPIKTVRNKESLKVELNRFWKEKGLSN